MKPVLLVLLCQLVVPAAVSLGPWLVGGLTAGALATLLVLRWFRALGERNARIFDHWKP